MTRPRSSLVSLSDTPAKLIELAAHRQQRALRGLAAAKRVFEATQNIKEKDRI